MSAIRSALDELAVTSDEELTTAELQGELAGLEAAHEIARALLVRKAQRLFELMAAEKTDAGEMADAGPSILGGVE